MTTEEDQIESRLRDALASIFCPISGCWPLHGGQSEFYFDGNTESYVLEAWPNAVEDTEELAGNGHHETEESWLYELAEFDFTEFVKVVALEHFHFSQLRSLFELGWTENGKPVELRVHIVPEDMDEELD